MELYSKNYKLLLVVPVVVFLVSLFFAFQLKMGIDFTGGTLIESPVNADFSASGLKAKLSSQFSLEDVSVRKAVGETVRLRLEFKGESSIIRAETALTNRDFETAITLSKAFSGELQVAGSLQQQADAYVAAAKRNFQAKLLSALSKELNTNEDTFSINAVGPSLGLLFLSQAQNALIVSFVLIVILVFVFFRRPIVSFGVMQAAIFDVIVGLGLMGALQIPMSLATVAPLLMLIGYSVDTDIMLTDRVLKRKTGTVHERLYGAIKTGLTMTGTTLGAVISLFIFSSLGGIEVLSSIALILAAGLAGDIVATWITNAAVILWYLERSHGHQ
ncbi:hypothetical protein HY546_01505 [archaeon]|nr:hypothetical protein [archaeon]